METNDKVYVEDLPWAKWRTAPPHVTEEILRALEPLAGLDPANWPRTRVKRWRNEENLFALPVWNGSDELFVLFSPREGRIHVVDMLYRQVIEQISGRSVAEFVEP